MSGGLVVINAWEGGRKTRLKKIGGKKKENINSKI